MGRIARLVLLAALLPAAAAAKDFEQRVAADAGGQLRVDLRGGAVVVESHEQPEVRVDALAAGMGSRSLDFELEADDDVVTLRGGGDGSWLPALVGGPHVRVRIRVPREFSVDVSTAGGSVELEGLEGEVRARTSGGRIELERIEGDVDAETSGGAIQAGRIQGGLRARTSGGPIRLFEIEGDVEAQTSGGPIEVLGAGAQVRARTSGGSITVRFSDAPAGDLETSGGSIDVEFPESEGVELDASTSGGRVEIEADIRLRGRVETNRVKAELNGGGDALRLRTSGGQIRVNVR
jgi:hypothetical protein